MQRYLGADYHRVRPYLMPTGTLAKTVACKRTLKGHGCQYRIVEESEPDGTYAAVCDNQHCPMLFFKRAELVRYTLNPQLLCPVIARCLGLRSQPPEAVSEVKHPVWIIGWLTRAAGSALPVVFTRACHEDEKQSILANLILRPLNEIILVTPTGRCHNCRIKKLLDQIGGGVLHLDEVTELQDHEPVLTEPGRTQWEALKASIHCTVGSAFPTPVGARWWDLSLRFRDGHTLVATIGRESRPLSFRDIGMEDSRTKSPNRQWRLLYAFAEERGILDWSSRHAHPRNQKQKELLASRLKSFFGLEGEPILTVGGGSRWETVFNVSLK